MGQRCVFAGHFAKQLRVTDLLQQGLVDWSWWDASRTQVVSVNEWSGVKFDRWPRELCPAIVDLVWTTINNLCHCGGQLQGRSDSFVNENSLQPRPCGAACRPDQRLVLENPNCGRRLVIG